MNPSRISTFVVVIALFALISGRVLAAGEKSSSEKPRRPNIIFLLTDDQRAGTFGVDGHPTIKTPNLDRLAADSVRFTNAFVTNPICKPSRVTYFGGQYERVHGVGFSSKKPLSERQWSKTYPALLRADGYYTGFIGKFGVESYVFRGHAQDKFDFWRAHDGWARFFSDTVENCKIYADSDEKIITPIMGESIDRFLDNRPADKPFCLSVSFSAPHGSISGSMYPEYDHGRERMTHAANTSPRLKNHPIYGNLYRDTPVAIPEQTATDPGKHIPKKFLDQKGRIGCYSYNYDKKTCLEHHFRYYQLITGIDRVVGRMRESLARRGLADNTVIIYSSDNGLLMGEYGMGGKALLYDLSTRVPMLVHDPSLPKEKRGKANEAFVLNLDVAPTILAYAGIDRPASMQGKNLGRLLNDPETDWRKEIFLENLYVGRDNPLSEAVRTKRWKYIRYFKIPRLYYRDEDVNYADKEPVFEQLFDLKNDPTENVNLAKDKKYAAVLKQLRTKCRAHSADLVQQRELLRGE